MHRNRIYVFWEHREEKVDPLSRETLALAARMARESGADLELLAFGSDPEKLAALTVEQTGRSTVAFVGPTLGQFHPELFRKVLTDFLVPDPPAWLFFPHCLAGAALAPLLAYDLGALCVTGVEKCYRQGDSIIAWRPVFKGKWREEVQITTGLNRPTVMSVQSGAAEGCFPPEGGGRFRIVPVTSRGELCRLVAVKQSRQGDDLEQARVVVAVGRGIGTPENLHLIEELAALFPRSAIGASRAVCDAGWLDYGKQVGLTGSRVSPCLYLACGISGTSQHLAGMRGAKWVVAINTDRNAPIFRAAQVGVVEDLASFIPLLTDAAQKGI